MPATIRDNDPGKSATGYFGNATPMTRYSGYQTWTNLLFSHWRVPPETLQTLLPDGLMVETFDGDGWLGMVPFAMEKVRPWWFPAVPGISWFLETNLRTYVTLPDGRSGVWFFSLDATKRLAVRVARRFWNLPYFDADLSLPPRCTRDQIPRAETRATGMQLPGRHATGQHRTTGHRG